eukprot:jgi/Mesen1/2554/ME000162S01677
MQPPGGSARTVTWAPPEYGERIAVCSTSGSVSVWESSSPGDKWRLSCVLQQSARSRVLALAFGKSASGLILVCASEDGRARVFESLDALHLHSWQLQGEFDLVSPEAVPRRIVRQGAQGPQREERQVACSAVSLSFRPSTAGDSQRAGSLLLMVIGTRGAVSAANAVKVLEFDASHARWHVLADLAPATGELPPVNDVAWAPNMGRSSDLIAAAAGESVLIWQLDYPATPGGALEVSQVATLGDHDSEVYQVGWDTSGATLASSGADNFVRLWRAGVNGTWAQRAAIAGEGAK